MNYKISLLFLVLAGSVFYTSCLDKAGSRISEFDSALPVGIDSPYESFKTVYHPENNALFFTNAREEGLYMQDPVTKKTNQLNTDNLSGFRLYFDKSGNKICYVKHEFIGKRRVKSLIIYDLNNHSQKELSTGKRQLKILELNKNVLYFLEDDQIKAFDLEDSQFIKNDKTTSVILNKDLSILVFRDGVRERILPAGKANYLWPSFSPDKKQILYSVSGKGTYICDLKGENIISLGRIHAPSWSPDGNWILGMDDYDDGHRFTKSDVVVVSRDGKERVNLTEQFDKIALYPAFSPNGKEVVFNDETGALYKMKVR